MKLGEVWRGFVMLCEVSEADRGLERVREIV